MGSAVKTNYYLKKQARIGPGKMYWWKRGECVVCVTLEKSTNSLWAPVDICCALEALSKHIYIYIIINGDLPIHAVGSKSGIYIYIYIYIYT